MYDSHEGSTRTQQQGGPAIWYGYCGRTGRFRMMDLPEYLTNMQQGMSRWVSDASSMYQEVARTAMNPAPGRYGAVHVHGPDCGCHDKSYEKCHDCHCDCCVCDADVLVHARCGEVRRIPITFENDTRREKPVKLDLKPFGTSGGQDLGWPAQLSETAFTLAPCDKHTVMVTLQVRCDKFGGGDTGGGTGTGTGTGAKNPDNPTLAATTRQPAGSVDRCQVAYAQLRADGCLIRPVVIAVAVLPDDCDAYRRPCSCGCCH